jgi:hypothetical protein
MNTFNRWHNHPKYLILNTSGIIQFWTHELILWKPIEKLQVSVVPSTPFSNEYKYYTHKFTDFRKKNMPLKGHHILMLYKFLSSIA